MFEVCAVIYHRRWDLFFWFKPEGLMVFKDEESAQYHCDYLNSYYETHDDEMPYYQSEIRFEVREV